VAIQHDFGWRFSMNWGGDSAPGKMPFRQVSVEVSFDLAGVAIQHGLKIAESYAQHISGISGLHPSCSKAPRFNRLRQRVLCVRDLQLSGRGGDSAWETLGESTGVAIQHDRALILGHWRRGKAKNFANVFSSSNARLDLRSRI
jgi:hypothetical protein